MSQFLINENIKMPAEAEAITGGSILVCSLEAQRNTAVPPVLSAAFGPACDENGKDFGPASFAAIPRGVTQGSWANRRDRPLGPPDGRRGPSDRRAAPGGPSSAAAIGAAPLGPRTRRQDRATRQGRARDRTTAPWHRTRGRCTYSAHRPARSSDSGGHSTHRVRDPESCATPSLCRR